MADNKVSVELSIEQAQALRSISDLTKGLDNFANKATRAANDASGAFSSFGKSVASIASGFILADVVEGFVSKIAEIPAALEAVVNMGIEANAATERLGNALAISGDASAQSAEDINKLSEEMSQLTGIEDEAIKNSASFALSLGATSEQTQKIIKAAGDMSAALGIDFNTAVQQLSLSLEGSAGRLGKLDSQIKGLSEESLKSGKAIDIISEKFKGFAEINAGNLETQIKVLGVNFNELKESFGAAVANSPALKAFFQVLNQTLGELKKQIDVNGPAIQEFTDTFINGFLTGAQVMAAFADAVGRGFAVIKNVVELGIGSLVTAFNTLAVGVDVVLSTFGKEVDTTALDRLNAGLKGLTEDSADLQKAIGPEAFVPGTQAVANFANAVEQANAKIVASESDKEAKKTDLAAQGQANRQRELDELLTKHQVFQIELASIEANAELERQARDAQLAQAGLIGDQEAITRLQDIEQQKLAVSFAAQEAKLRLITDTQKREEETQKLAAQKHLAFEQLKTKQEVENAKTRSQNFKDTLSTISSLQSSGVKELFFVGKAAAMATATIDGIAAVQKALASAPPPFNFVLAGLVGAATAANIAKIGAQQPPAFADGGIVGGNSFAGDKVIARVNSSEMVLNKQQQSELFSIANGGGSSGGVIQAINALGDRIANMNIIVQANAREIARLVRDEREAGFAV